MKHDFRSILETPEEPRKFNNEPRRTPAGPPSGVFPGFRGWGDISISPPPSPESRKNPGNHGGPGEPRKPSGKNTARAPGIREALALLYGQAEDTRHQVDVAAAMQDPFESAFRAADATLRHMHQRRDVGADIARADMFAAYDRRMWAGHAWHPHRERLRDMNRWLKAIQKEITEMNVELERIMK